MIRWRRVAAITAASTVIALLAIAVRGGWRKSAAAERHAVRLEGDETVLALVDSTVITQYDLEQTLVTIGVDLAKMRTVGDLQGGIEEAERQLGFRVTRPADAQP